MLNKPKQEQNPQQRQNKNDVGASQGTPHQEHDDASEWSLPSSPSASSSSSSSGAVLVDAVDNPTSTEDDWPDFRLSSHSGRSFASLPTEDGAASSAWSVLSTDSACNDDDDDHSAVMEDHPRVLSHTINVVGKDDSTRNTMQVSNKNQQDKDHALPVSAPSTSKNNADNDEQAKNSKHENTIELSETGQFLQLATIVVGVVGFVLVFALGSGCGGDKGKDRRCASTSSSSSSKSNSTRDACISVIRPSVYYYRHRRCAGSYGGGGGYRAPGSDSFWLFQDW